MSALLFSPFLKRFVPGKNCVEEEELQAAQGGARCPTLEEEGSQEAGFL
jgi:hypothetical protein